MREREVRHVSKVRGEDRAFGTWEKGKGWKLWGGGEGLRYISG